LGKEKNNQAKVVKVHTSERELFAPALFLSGTHSLKINKSKLKKEINTD